MMSARPYLFAALLTTLVAQHARGQQCCPTSNTFICGKDALTAAVLGACQTCCPAGMFCAKTGCRKTVPPASTFGGVDTCSCTLGAGCTGDCGGAGKTSGGGYVCRDTTPYACSDNGGITNNEFCCDRPYCCQGGRAGCASSKAACEQAATPTCPAESPVACANGRCCRSDQVCCPGGGCCPLKHPVCTADGCCPSATPYGCSDGQCYANLSDCPSGCPDNHQRVAGLHGRTACCPAGLQYPCAKGGCANSANCNGLGLLGADEPTGGAGGSGGGNKACPTCSFNCTTTRECSDWAALSRCSYRACACATDPSSTCYRTWYETNTGRVFECDACVTGCKSAADAVTNTCI